MANSTAIIGYGNQLRPINLWVIESFTGLIHTTIEFTKRSPFSILAERRLFLETTPHCPTIKPGGIIEPDSTTLTEFVQVFMQPLPPHLAEVAEVAGFGRR